MGTNFHHRTNICPCCGRFDDRHICKSWTSFQGYRPDSWPDGDKTSILSWEDWKRVLREGGEVWDEYGTKADTEEFIRDVEATSVEWRSRQFRWVESHTPSSVVGAEPRDWMDPEGFSFHDGEFF